MGQSVGSGAGHLLSHTSALPLKVDQSDTADRAYLPRFRVLALFGGRSPERVASSSSRPSENLPTPDLSRYSNFRGQNGSRSAGFSPLKLRSPYVAVPRHCCLW